jgi:hypothetical protein
MPLGSAPPLKPRDAAAILYAAKWTELTNLFKTLATMLAESNLYPKAWHWNDPAAGGDGSTDWGWMQLNDGAKGGKAPALDANGDAIPVTQYQKDALDPVKAATMARAIWDEPWPGGIRGITAWAAYTSGAWKKYMATSATGVRNFLAVKYGFPLY